jgi:hypothetical protein
MMNNKHTPAPWEVSKHATPEYAPQYGVYSDGARNDHVIVTGRQCKADAALIAAAPELLRSVKALSNWMREHTSPTQSDTPHDILVEAVELIKTIENGAWAVQYSTGEEILK